MKKKGLLLLCIIILALIILVYNPRFVTNTPSIIGSWVSKIGILSYDFKQTYLIPPINYSTWTVYKNSAEKYQLKAPQDWEVTHQTNGVNFKDEFFLAPKSRENNFRKYFDGIFVTTIVRPYLVQPMTTVQEFVTWYNKPNENIDFHGTPKIQKVDDTIVDGNQAIIFSDGFSKPKTKEGWSYVIWLRRQNTNYYIAIQGENKFTKDTTTLILFVIKNFHFI